MAILLLRMLKRDCPGATVRECCCQRAVSSSHHAPGSARSDWMRPSAAPFTGFPRTATLRAARIVKRLSHRGDPVNCLRLHDDLLFVVLIAERAQMSDFAVANDQNDSAWNLSVVHSRLEGGIEYLQARRRKPTSSDCEAMGSGSATAGKAMQRATIVAE